jgi:hypothetical protein
MLDSLTMSLTLMADSSQAMSAMRDYVQPTMQLLVGLAGIASIFFLTYGGFAYMTSRGQPDKLEGAKRILKNALIGLVIVLGAATLTALLSGAMQTSTAPSSGSLPSLQAIEPNTSGNGLVDVIINAVTGLLNNIIQAVATPFLAALTFFTSATPLMAENPSVFNLWLVVVGMTNVLFVVVVALIGFQVMSASTFGLDEIEFKHLLPRIGLTFLLMNTSIFLIDGFIRLSNVLIAAISKAGDGTTVWSTLTEVVEGSGGQGVAALLIMFAFLIFSVILLVYYVSRLVTLFIGAVVSPLVILIWLVPGFRDFSETAMKSYLTTIFVLFIHVVILLLAASLFSGMSAGSGSTTPNTLIAMVTGLATIIALLKTQGVMMQFSYVSLGPRSMRQLGSQFMNGVSYLGGKSRGAVGVVSSKVGGKTVSGSSARSTGGASKRSGSPSSSYQQPHSTPSVTVVRRSATGQTMKAPIVGSANQPLVTSRKLSDRRIDAGAQTNIHKEDYRS